jgi:hypothetical protein
VKDLHAFTGRFIYRYIKAIFTYRGVGYGGIEESFKGG